VRDLEVLPAVLLKNKAFRNVTLCRIFKHLTMDMVKHPRSFDSSQTFGLLNCACHWLYKIQTLYKPITWKGVVNITKLTASRAKQRFYSETIHSNTIARWGEAANWLHLPAPSPNAPLGRTINTPHNEETSVVFW